MGKMKEMQIFQEDFRNELQFGIAVEKYKAYENEKKIFEKIILIFQNKLNKLEERKY